MSRPLALCVASFTLGVLLTKTATALRQILRQRRTWGAPGLKARLIEQRRRHFCAAQSVSYANVDPLVMVRGYGARLVDEAGRVFVDTRNNVCHVGHAHPRVAAAVAEQVATLNTNTRYLHMNVCELARRLLATFPKPLSDGVVFFVNSGSEANDLALRLARAKAGHRPDGKVLVVEHAYHGHTHAAIGLSPYKYKHASFGGGAKPPYVEACAAPDVYRGPHRGPTAAAAYAADVEAHCARGAVDAFFIESGMSVAGVILPPQGYLRLCYAAVRAAGGVCVADEVQTGLGRFGKWWWGFEQQGVVPDIVTMGKPMGNGMPLAAVVCTREIGDAFAQGPEYFNTFGGNPVCAAAGLAVLDVIEREKLRENATQVGDYLMQRLRCLSSTPQGELIGSVRGCGLFIGVEFVKDGVTLEPASLETSYLCSKLKDAHLILTSIDGPHNNVLVIKPPLCFSKRDCDTLIDALSAELLALRAVNLSTVTHTPT
ncbi:hypothetical protein AB1Y20_019528 [Prymnesium parvum]|uniref:Acetylornithine transaminase n=1 Tax=Prymnesium parvum TaxID=97485 RepID=A0AB34JV88_PRYPA